MAPLAAPLLAEEERCAASADGLRFEVYRRAAAAHTRLDELPAAARMLKEALALRPAHVAVVATLDALARRAAADGIELEPLPPAPPEAFDDDEGDDDDDDDDEEEAEEAAAAAAATAAGAAGAGEAGAGGATEAKPPQAGGAAAAAAASSTKPPVGTRGAAQLKADADAAFKEARVGRAIALYGKALKADAAAEWMGGGGGGGDGAAGGLYFRCQCLANRSACHLKMRQYGECIDDAGAALAALGAGASAGGTGGAAGAESTTPLMLKLLARRGMALCQLVRYDDAKADYERALALDPANPQLQKDLQMIDAVLKKK